MNGGYINIDCTGLDLEKGETPQTISGIYSRVKNAMKLNKPLFCVNATWKDFGGVTPVQCFAIQTASDTITVTASTLQIIISDDDSIIINNMVA